MLEYIHHKLFIQNTNLIKGLIYLLLCVFILVRGAVPVGFMPAMGAQTSMYVMCHGDLASAQIINSLRKDIGESFSSLKSSKEYPAHHAENVQCTFSAFLNVLLLGVVGFFSLYAFLQVIFQLCILLRFIFVRSYTPAIRAPPLFFRCLLQRLLQR